MGREQEVKVMPAKYRQGDELLRDMLAHANNSNYFVYGRVGEFWETKAVYRDLE